MSVSGSTDHTVPILSASDALIEVMRLNVLGPHRMILGLIDTLKQTAERNLTGHAVIFHIGSLSSRAPIPGNGPLSASSVGWD